MRPEGTPVALCGRGWRALPHARTNRPFNYRWLRRQYAGMAHAQLEGMKLSQTFLRTISRELYHGNPWWALVVANEYLNPTSPLHAALVKLFHGRVPERSDLSHRLTSGARYHELSITERDRVGSRVMRHRSSTPITPREHGGTRSCRDRRPPVRRDTHIAPIIGVVSHARRLHRASGPLTSTASLAAPALRVVQGAARRSS